MLTWNDVGVVIRAVENRRIDSIAALVSQIETFVPEHAISWHGDGRSVPESYTDALSRWRGCDVQWVLQFEDDVVLSHDFAVQAMRLLNEAASQPNIGLVSFYSGRRLKVGEFLPSAPILEYLPGSRFLMAQAIAMRSDTIGEHNEFVLHWTCTNNRPYGTDTATALWLRTRKLRLARAWPSLVQHRAVDSMCCQRNSDRPHSPNPMRMSPSFEAAYGSIQCTESSAAM